MAIRDEMARRIPPANREALHVAPGGSVFDATEGGLSVDSIVYSTRTGEVLVGRAMVHQTLLDR